MTGNPARSLPLHLVYFALGFIALGAGLLEMFRCYSFHAFEEDQAIAAGMAFISGGLWQVVAPRLRRVGALTLSEFGVDLGVVVATLAVALNSFAEMTTHPGSEMAVLGGSLFALSSLVGFLALQVNTVRSADELARVVGRWVSLLGVAFIGLCMLVVAIVGLYGELGMERHLISWFALTSTGALTTWVLLRFGAPSSSFQLAPSPSFPRAISASLSALALCAAMADVNPALLIPAGLFGLLTLDMFRANLDLRVVRGFLGSMLAVMTAFAAVACFVSKMHHVMLAPLGIATSIALVMAVFDQLDDRCSANTGWLIVAAGMFGSALLTASAVRWSAHLL